MKFISAKSEDSEWGPIADLMSGLMMVFLFISVSYMLNVKNEKDNIEKEKNKMREVAVEYNRLQTDLYNDLKIEFENDLKKWGAVLDKKTLSVRFEEPEILFDAGRFEIKKKFREILDDFFPRYIKRIYDEKYRNDIAEIRIEGHTSSEWQYKATASEAYFFNMELSQNRTRAVLHYVLTDIYFDKDVEEWIKKTTTANGLSSSKLLFNDNDEEDKIKSRRVEFRVRTNSEERIVKILEIGE